MKKAKKSKKAPVKTATTKESGNGGQPSPEVTSATGSSPPLVELERRLGVVRDNVRFVGNGSQTGFYLYGRPGTSKTYTVRRTLEQAGYPYVYQVGHITDMGLFELLEEHPNGTIVLDDVGAIFNQRKAVQMLLAALGRQSADQENGRPVRLIKYKRQGKDVTVRFTGGLVAVSNLDLHGHDSALLDALRSRVTPLNYDPDDEQIEALIHHIASKGWPENGPKLTPQECKMVADFLLEKLRKEGVRPDIRIFVDKALPKFLQCKIKNAETDWKDILAADVQEAVVELVHTPKSKKQEKADQHQIVRRLFAEFETAAERVKAWVERTGDSQRTFYRRAKEIGLI